MTGGRSTSGQPTEGQRMALRAGIRPLTAVMPGLDRLWSRTTGDPRIVIAVLDGPVDLSHPSFAGGLVESSHMDSGPPGRMTAHGTHVASIVFSQPASGFRGVAAGCRGLAIPIFADGRDDPTSQTELAAAIDRAVEAGAHVINISGGERLEPGGIEPAMMQAIQKCEARNVLVVAAAGNDGCHCLHAPAAHPAVLAVGASGSDGQPLELSNWGDAYQANGVLAPGEDIVGAGPGAGYSLRTGTSFATPLVSGVAGLLLSLQARLGQQPDPAGVRRAILQSADPCDARRTIDCRRTLAGSLNISGALQFVLNGDQTMSEHSEHELLNPGGEPASAASAPAETSIAESPPAEPTGAQPAERAPSPTPAGGMQLRTDRIAPVSTAGEGGSGSGRIERRVSGAPSGIMASCGCRTSESGAGGLVYALGTLRYDFGTEARRDGFKTLMPSVKYTPVGSYPYVAYYHPNDLNSALDSGPAYPANPYDVQQMAHYLAGFPLPQPPYPVRGGLPSTRGQQQGVVVPGQHPRFPVNPTQSEARNTRCVVPTLPDGYPGYEGNISEANELIWVLYLEETPLYALRPTQQFSTEVYQFLVEVLAGQTLPHDDDGYVERVSIPAILTGEKVQLFSGHRVDVVEPRLRGMYSWNTTALVNSALDTVRTACEQRQLETAAVDRSVESAQNSLRQFLDRIYFDLRNPGRTSAERALNFAATNAFQVASILIEAATDGSQLDYIGVEQTAFSRPDSDCWDVKLKFFDPENDRRARKVYRFTIDVSDSYPVQVGDMRVWTESGYER